MQVERKLEATQLKLRSADNAMLLFPFLHHLLALLISLATLTAATEPTDTQKDAVKQFFNKNGGSTSKHTNNWAVLVCTSRYWFNYRHMSNALGMYRTVKRLGIPDSNIILMLADDASCNARNRFPGSVFANSAKALDLYGENIEVDYRGYEVTVENFIRVLTGRMDPSVPRSKRLLTDEHSNIFVYMTGHGGNEFLKFQDNEEISAFDLADAFEQMYQKKRYNEIFFMADTCQAVTLHTKFYSPNILAVGSAQLGQNSYSHSNDDDIGVAIIDGFTHHILEFMEGLNKTSHVTMKELFDSFDPAKIKSQPGVRSDLYQRPLDQALLTDFFGGVSQIEVVDNANTGVSATAFLHSEHSSNQARGEETRTKQTNINRPPHNASQAAETTPRIKSTKGQREKPTPRAGIRGEWDWSAKELKNVRAWLVSVGLVGLVGWVVVK